MFDYNRSFFQRSIGYISFNYIFICLLLSFACTVIWNQVILFDTNNLHTVIWFHITLSNTNNFQTFGLTIGHEWVLPIEIRIDLGIMVMKRYPTLTGSPELEPHHPMKFSDIPSYPFWRVFAPLYSKPNQQYYVISFLMAIDRTLAWWLECFTMARKTWIQSQVESYQRLKNGTSCFLA